MDRGTAEPSLAASTGSTKGPLSPLCRRTLGGQRDLGTLSAGVHRVDRETAEPSLAASTGWTEGPLSPLCRRPWVYRGTAEPSPRGGADDIIIVVLVVFNFTGQRRRRRRLVAVPLRQLCCRQRGPGLQAAVCRGPAVLRRHPPAGIIQRRHHVWIDCRSAAVDARQQPHSTSSECWSRSDSTTRQPAQQCRHEGTEAARQRSAFWLNKFRFFDDLE